MPKHEIDPSTLNILYSQYQREFTNIKTPNSNGAKKDIGSMGTIESLEDCDDALQFPYSHHPMVIDDRKQTYSFTRKYFKMIALAVSMFLFLILVLIIALLWPKGVEIKGMSIKNTSSLASSSSGDRLEWTLQGTISLELKSSNLSRSQMSGIIIRKWKMDDESKLELSSINFESDPFRAGSKSVDIPFKSQILRDKGDQLFEEISAKCLENNYEIEYEFDVLVSSMGMRQSIKQSFTQKSKCPFNGSELRLLGDRNDKNSEDKANLIETNINNKNGTSKKAQGQRAFSDFFKK